MYKRHILKQTQRRRYIRRYPIAIRYKKPSTLYRPSLPLWVIQEYTEHAKRSSSSKVLQRFAKLVIRKRRAARIIQSWWKKDPQFDYL